MSYLKRCGTNYKEMSLFDFDLHDKIRENFEWRSESSWILLKDIQDDHLINILKYISTEDIQPDVQIIQVFVDEFYYRWRELIYS